jgi:hypothetical protein
MKTGDARKHAPRRIACDIPGGPPKSISDLAGTDVMERSRKLVFADAKLLLSQGSEAQRHDCRIDRVLSSPMPRETRHHIASTKVAPRNPVTSASLPEAPRPDVSP